MKNALLLHGTDGNSKTNWFPWLKKQLENKGWKVWLPDLPNSHFPNTKRYNEYILNNKEWKLNKDSIIIGHSSGSVSALGLLQNLPENICLNKVILISSFMNNLGWDNLDGLFEEPMNFEKIKKHAKEFILIHSDNDPYCPLEHAEYLSKKLNGKLIIKKGEQHFGIEAGGKKYKEFPYLLEII